MRRLYEDFIPSSKPDWTEPFIQYDHMYIEGLKLFKRTASDNRGFLRFRIPETPIKLESDTFDMYDNDSAWKSYHEMTRLIRIVTNIKEIHDRQAS
jgi:hypothetical protein